MPSVQFDSGEIYYEQWGSGPETLVFSHGLLFSHEAWTHQVEALADDYRCITYDHRGQGRSSVPDAPMVDTETLYLDAAALIDELGAAPSHFVGLSMGGFVGLRLAARLPELLRSLTLMSTRAPGEPLENQSKYRGLNFIARWFGTRWAVDRIMPIMFGGTFLEDPQVADRRERWRDHLAGLDNSIYKSVNGVLYRPSVERELSRIDVPTLVMHGDEDEAIPFEEAEALTEAIDDARLVQIPRAGHSPAIEQPEAVNEALAGFLGEVS